MAVRSSYQGPGVFIEATDMGKDLERSSGLCDISQLISDCVADIESRN